MLGDHLNIALSTVEASMYIYERESKHSLKIKPAPVERNYCRRDESIGATDNPRQRVAIVSRVKDSATAEVTNGFAGTKAAGQIVKSVETTFAISQGAQYGASPPLFYHSIKTHSGISLFSPRFLHLEGHFFRLG